jgi:hypothetical protein
MKNIVSTLALAAALILPAVGANPARGEKLPLNACGCRGEGNNCTCEKKGKCGCPGECEPKGCEEARAKQLQKEVDEETKRAKEAEKAHNKSKDEAKAAADDDDAAKAAAAKAPAVKPMSASAKKQFGKLIDAYLAEHPEAKNKMLWEVQGELK